MPEFRRSVSVTFDVTDTVDVELRNMDDMHSSWAESKGMPMKTVHAGDVERETATSAYEGH